ncbi:hypothetical protein M378DRAFT_11871 [Amanita muscaria Koide BX008]|uniref:Uncharacterized protein n=1 Tax=Amanita muscaria (strain Koide BX008) TaxID=946122 RepID=A0A0C2X3J0_AMAMK|nr:hypothetical protein M378DRAFT_11871 [Amanita muscaria Koide BX008]
MSGSPQDSIALTTWFQGEIDKLYKIPQQADFDAEFARLFTSDARIILDHVPVSVDELRSTLAASQFAAVSQEVEWKDIQEKKVNEKDGESNEEIVAGCYIVTRSLKFRIRVTPAQTKSHVVFSAKIRAHSGHKKLTEFFITIITKPVPVVLPHIPNVTS